MLANIKVNAPKMALEVTVREYDNPELLAEMVFTQGHFSVEGMREALAQYFRQILPVTGFSHPCMVTPFYPTNRGF